MARRILILGVALAIAFSVGLSAQGKEKPVELTMAFLGFGTPPDLQMVQDALSAQTQGKINATVKFLPINYGTWNQQMNLILASNEKLDLMISGTAYLGFDYQVARNQLLPLDELIAKYGDGVKASMEASYLRSGQVKGKTYGVPTVRDLASAGGILMRKDILDKHGIDPSSIKSLDDVGTLFKTIKQKEPDLIPTMPSPGGRSFADYLYTWDRLGDSIGVLMNYGANLKVVNLYTTPEYKAMIQRFRDWYKAGYVLQDAATNKDDAIVFFKANKIFSEIVPLKPGFDTQESKRIGMELVPAWFRPAAASTDTVANIMWSIPRNARNPEKSMQLLNLMYSDTAVINLLDWGIEGRHYVKLSDGRIDYPKGIDGTNTGYGMNTGWQFGNQLLSLIWKDDPASLWGDMQKFNKTAFISKALGFTFDPTPVKTQYAAVNNVLNQYRLGLEDGVLDPSDALSSANQKMTAAGIDKIIVEKQKQLDAWARAK